MPRFAPQQLCSLDQLESVSGGASRRLYESLGTDPPSHTNVLLSDPLPHGTSYEDANHLLQRYNAPTWAVIHGQGNAPDEESARVYVPGYTPEWAQGVATPLGHVDVTHGDGFVVNTTGNLRPGYEEQNIAYRAMYGHAMVGTITRSLVMDDDGRYRVMTVGQGEGGNAGALRHELNNAYGPNAFTEVDRHMIARAETEQMDRFTAQDLDNRYAGLPGAFGEDPITTPRPIEGGEPTGGNLPTETIEPRQEVAAPDLQEDPPQD